MSFANKLCRALGFYGDYEIAHAIRFAITATLLRVIYLFVFPFSLIGDESYYWEWGRNLDWGYYSKPPMIGWLMGITHLLGAETAPFVRLPATLFGGGILYLQYLIGRTLFSPKIGFFAMFFLCVSPAHSALCLLFTIDAPLLFFWSLALLAFWKVFYEEKGFAWIIILILGLGLGNLTKQMTLVFSILGVLVLVLDHSKRKFLRLPMLWLGWLATLLFLIPTLWWNYQNDWIMVSHTASHVSKEVPALGRRLSFFAEFIISESIIIGPVVFFTALHLFFWQSRVFWKVPAKRFLFMFSVPAFCFFLLLSFNQRINPNWPAVFYLPFFLLVSAYFLEKPKTWLFKSWNSFRKTNLISSSFLLILLYFLPFASGIFSLDGTKYDLFKRFRGYEQYAEQVMEAKFSLPDTKNVEIVVVGHRYDACQLAFSGIGQPTVLTAPNESGVSSQYDIWSKRWKLGRKNALLVCHTSHPIPKSLAKIYQKIELLPKNIRIPFPAGKQLFFDLYFAQVKKTEY